MWLRKGPKLWSSPSPEFLRWTLRSQPLLKNDPPLLLDMGRSLCGMGQLEGWVWSPRLC